MVAFVTHSVIITTSTRRRQLIKEGFKMYKFSEVQLPKEIKSGITKIKVIGCDKWFTVDFVAPIGTELRLVEIMGFFESHQIAEYSFDGSI